MSDRSTYVYDGVGNLKQITDANQQVTTFDYDDNNRLTTRNAPGTADDLSITYENGQVKTLTGGGTVTTFDYETGTGRTAKRTDAISAVGTPFSTYGYDNNDNLTQVGYPSGRVVTYEYTSERLATVRQNGNVFAQNFNYNDAGQLDSYLTGAVTHTFSYDIVDRIEHITSGVVGAAPGNKLDLLYGYDNVNNVRSITDPRAGANQTFTLDPLDRLATATGPWPSLGWSYDNAGNRLTETSGAATTNYTYHAPTQRLSGAGSETFQYDNNGQLLADGTTQYAYTPSGKLATATKSGVNASYTYDAAGARLAQTVNDTTTYSLRALSGETLSEYVGACASAVWSRDLVYAGGRLLGAVKATTLQPTVSLTTMAISVGESGNATLDVRLTTPTGANLACPVTVNYQTTAGTATAGTDYTTTSGTLAFGAGTPSGTLQQVSVPIVTDSADEVNETFTVGLSGATGAAIGTASSTVTIVDDDPPSVAFSASASSVGESAGSVTIAVTLTSAVTLPSAVSVSYGTANGTATAGSDYTSTSGTVTFAAGSGNGATQTLTVPLIADGLYEGNETFTVTLSTPSGATIGSPSVTTVTIVEDDPTPDPHVVLESPGDGTIWGSHVTVSGWAIDTHALSGSGMTAMYGYAYPNADESQTPIGLGYGTYGLWRSDVASSYGNQFGYSGFSLDAVLPGPGVYRIKGIAYDQLAGAWQWSGARDITVGPTPRMWVDTPGPGVVASWFWISGWAIDAGAGSGTGVDLIHVWAYPTSGAPAIFLGSATYGGSRPDVGAAFGSQFAPSGYGLYANLGAGSYNVVVYAHSSVTNSFSQAQSIYPVTVSSGLLLNVDSPATNATVGQPFSFVGWAIDTSSYSGTGVPFVHIWAWPDNGSPAVFLGQGDTGTSRPEVGAWAQDSRFTPSGWTVNVNGLAAGGYYISIYPYSSVTGTWGAPVTLHITVQ